MYNKYKEIVMAKINTNISLDKDLKKQAVILFKELGLDLSTAISLFLQQSVREQRIPFMIGKNIPNAETVAALEEFKEMKEDKEKYKRYDTCDDMLKDIK